ncbi:aldolase [Actinomadura barringtoniae]|uniref:Aldolase n=1 Tax=Actinomadura barringtoniae TaxID=1427535 RepID=A0A939PNV8_9ACTN|nr:aldolase [Actinomadura barringtoniae]MBO2453389.1 aldolase [Actinomadura barringtoniae]
MSTGTFAERYAELVETRAARPGAIAEAAARRARPGIPLGAAGRLMIIAADHPARGALRAGADPQAMGNRRDLLERICAGLARPGVHGVLATPDIMEDLLLLGELEGRFAIGSMNRGGLAGASFEIDDRFTAYTAAAIAAAGLDGGKMLLRVDLGDPATAPTLEACGNAVTELAAHDLPAMVEPFLSVRRDDGKIANVLTPEAMIKVISIASGLGATSAHTWLKVPVVDRMEEVMEASTLPALLLGGEVPDDPEAALAGWKAALDLPTVRGLIVGRSVLYPPGDDVAGAIDAAVELL